MYDFIDRHPNRLGNAGRFMLWAMRGWSQATARKTCPPVALHRGFAHAGAVAALTDFHLSMLLINRDGLDKFEMSPMSSCRIAEDEALLLALWRGVVVEDADLVSGTLKRMVKIEAVLPIARAMSGCCAHLALAGLDLTETQVQNIED